MPAVKIVHITTAAISLRYLLLNQLCELRSIGYEVQGISTPGQDASILKASGIGHIPVPMTRRFSPLLDVVAFINLLRILRRSKPTIVHTHTPKPGLLGQVAAKFSKIPIIINTVHGYYFTVDTPKALKALYVISERIASFCSDTIFFQNHEDMQIAISKKICRSDKARYLGNGIDLKLFNRNRLNDVVIASKRRELGIAPGELVVGFVGRLVREKGILELLQAAAYFEEKHKGVRFLVIGSLDRDKDGSLTQAELDFYNNSGICVFAGLRNDMSEMYAIMDVFVLPSYREGFPRSSMEAAAMGVPCIVSDIRGCRETVEHERNGILVPSRNVPALCAAIERLLADPDKRKLMGIEGRRLSVERFDEQVVFTKVKDEYERLLQKKNLIKSPVRTHL